MSKVCLQCHEWRSLKRIKPWSASGGINTWQFGKEGVRFLPVLVNMFFCHVPKDARPRESCQLVRVADDFVVALENRQSGERWSAGLG